MIGLGTIINVVAIILGGVLGRVFRKLFTKEISKGLQKACGISTMFISIAGAMEGMLKVENGSVTSGKAMLVVLCVVFGTLAGELIRIERGFEKFGELIRNKTGNAGDAKFVDAFLAASLTVCIGAMAIVGSIQDGISGNFTTLAVKSVLDFIIIAAMTVSLGKGAVFSAIPILLFEGSMTLLASFIAPLLTGTALSYLSLVGSVLIFCVGVNLVWGKKFRVANMLPAVFLAAALAYIPFDF